MSVQSGPLIILDRDGVINHDSENYIKSPDEWRPLDRSLEAIARLTHAGWSVAVATNQSGIERGLFDISTLHAIHTKMMAAVADAGGRIDGIFFCPHAPDAGCDCRKPAAGLLRDISARFNKGLAGIPLVGDSLRDLKAGLEMDCALWLVKTGKGARTLVAAEQDAESALPYATRIADDLFGAVDQILKGSAAH